MAAWIRALALVLGVEPPSAAPPPQPTTLVVTGACDDSDAMRQRLSSVITSPDAAVQAVTLTAEQHDQIWHGTLTFEVDGETHERSLSAESCAALYEASALVIGLTVQPLGPTVDPSDPAVDPPTTDEPSTDEPSPEPADDATAVPGPPQEQPPATDDPREPIVAPPPTIDTSPPRLPTPTARPGRLRIRGRLGAGAAFGVLHPVHPVVVAGVAVRGQRWAVGIDGLYLPPLTNTVGLGARAIVQLVAAQVRGCPVWRFVDERLVLPVCAGLAAGSAWGRGDGIAIVARRGRDAWVAALLGPRLQLRAPWGGDLWISTELVVPIYRPQFVLDGIGAACCEAPVGGVLSLGGGFSGPRKRI